jgi:vacuolar protein sorting-associated protein 29
MVLVLAIGDLNIPYDAVGIPEKFQKMLIPGKIQHVFITGNLNTRDVEEFFTSLGAQILITKGDMDTVCSLGKNQANGTRYASLPTKF